MFNKCTLCGVEATVTFGVNRRSTLATLKAMGAPTNGIVCLCGPCMDKAEAATSTKPITPTELNELGIALESALDALHAAYTLMDPEGFKSSESTGFRIAMAELAEKLSRVLRR